MLTVSAKLGKQSVGCGAVRCGVGARTCGEKLKGSLINEAVRKPLKVKNGTTEVGENWHILTHFHASECGRSQISQVGCADGRGTITKWG